MKKRKYFIALSLVCLTTICLTSCDLVRGLNVTIPTTSQTTVAPVTPTTIMTPSQTSTPPKAQETTIKPTTAQTTSKAPVKTTTSQLPIITATKTPSQTTQPEPTTTSSQTTIVPTTNVQTTTVPQTTSQSPTQTTQNSATESVTELVEYECPVDAYFNNKIITYYTGNYTEGKFGNYYYQEATSSNGNVELAYESRPQAEKIEMAYPFLINEREYIADISVHCFQIDTVFKSNAGYEGTFAAKISCTLKGKYYNTVQNVEEEIFLDCTTTVEAVCNANAVNVQVEFGISSIGNPALHIAIKGKAALSGRNQTIYKGESYSMFAEGDAEIETSTIIGRYDWDATKALCTMVPKVYCKIDSSGIELSINQEKVFCGQGTAIGEAYYTS